MYLYTCKEIGFSPEPWKNPTHIECVCVRVGSTFCPLGIPLPTPYALCPRVGFPPCEKIYLMFLFMRNVYFYLQKLETLKVRN